MPHHGSCSTDPDALGPGFSMVPWAASDDPQLSPTDLHILERLLRYAFRLRYYPGHDALADDTRTSRATACRSLATLHRTGWIQLDRGRPGYTCSISIPGPARRLPMPDPRRLTGETSKVTPARRPTSHPRDTSQDLREELQLARFYEKHGKPPTMAEMFAQIDAREAAAANPDAPQARISTQEEE